ncbi:MAG: hypothetical protein GX162_01045 [Firmicutes bacterium]|jgi:hypothetical protein|nr:hypothetical protein [Bacillota bacterium]
MIHGNKLRLRLSWVCITAVVWLGLAQVATAFDFDFDEEELFGSFSFVDELDESAPAEDFLIQEGADFGGSFNFSMNSSWMWSDPERFGQAPDEEVLTNTLEATFFADIRPKDDYRIFGKATVSYPFTESEAQGEQPARGFDDIVQIRELFADFDHDDKWFFRVGKQTIGWGVGYFFSPADIINLTPIDPEDPEAEREGPLSIKINRPVDRHNLYLYLLADQATRLDELAVAPKAEIVLGGTEVGMGAYVRKDRAPMAMFTLSSGLGKTAVFAETVVKHGSDKRFVRHVAVTPDNPLGLELLKRDDEYFFSATGGLRYSYADDEGRYNLTFAAQYFYNGEGYDDPGSFVEASIPLYALGQLSASDLEWPSKHYGAASLLWTDVLRSGISANLFCLSSLTDASGYARASLSWEPWDRISTSVGVSYVFGQEGGVYTIFGNPLTLDVRVSLGSGRF